MKTKSIIAFAAMSLSFFLLLSIPVAARQSSDKELSAYDQARLVSHANNKVIAYFVKNNAAFEELTTRLNISASNSLNYNREMNLIANLYNPQVSKTENFRLIYKLGLRAEPLIQMNAIDIDFVDTIAFGRQSEEVLRQIAVQVNTSPSDEQKVTITGSSPSPQSSSFTTNVLSGASSLLLDRARKELSAAFFDDFTAKLAANQDLSDLFPNTLLLMQNRDQYTLPSLGPAWQGAFEADLQQLPAHMLKVLERKLPEDQNKMEMVRLLLYSLTEMEQGRHPYYIINNWYQQVPADSRYYKPLQAVSILSHGLRANQLNSNDDAARVWASRTDIASLGAEGRLVLCALLFKELKEEGIVMENVDEAWINQTLQQINSLVTAFDLTQNTIKAARNSQGDQTEQLLTAFEATLTGLSAASDILLGTMVQTGSTTESTSLKEWSMRLDQAAVAVQHLGKVQQRVKNKDYEGVLTQILQVMQALNNRTYQQIEASLKTARTEIANTLAEEDNETFNPLITFLGEDKHFSFDSRRSLEELLSGIQQALNTVIANIDAKKQAFVRREVHKAIVHLSIALPPQYTRYLTLLIEVVEAESGEEIQAALEAVILPVGSYKLKRSPGQRSIFLQGYAGLQAGYEWSSGTDDYNGFAWGLSLPIGVEFTRSGLNKSSYWGLFVTLIDLGAIGNFNLSNQDEVDMPDVSLSQVVSPGLFITHGFSGVPLTMGAGLRYAPQLRELNATSTAEEQILDVVQANVFLGVDIPLARLRHKIKD